MSFYNLVNCADQCQASFDREISRSLGIIQNQIYDETAEFILKPENAAVSGNRLCTQTAICMRKKTGRKKGRNRGGEESCQFCFGMAPRLGSVPRFRIRNNLSCGLQP